MALPAGAGVPDDAGNRRADTAVEAPSMTGAADWGMRQASAGHAQACGGMVWRGAFDATAVAGDEKRPGR